MEDWLILNKRWSKMCQGILSRQTNIVILIFSNITVKHTRKKQEGLLQILMPLFPKILYSSKRIN